MDITPDNSTTQPISDDQELAKALAGVLPDDSSTDDSSSASSDLQFEETGSAAPVTPPVATPAATPTDDTAALLPPFPGPAFEQPAPAAETSTPPTLSTSASTELDGIKSEALNELRPLIDHVDLSPEEKYDAYLMLIRSTDDPSLISPAHAAAQGISDEKRKAEALLDIIKEIDYLSKKDSATL